MYLHVFNQTDATVSVYYSQHLESVTGVEGQRDGKLCSSGKGGTDGKDLSVCTCMCGSAHDCRCVVDSSSAMAAS